jgi:hypothetical protein
MTKVARPEEFIKNSPQSRPLLLTRIQKRQDVAGTFASAHMTIGTTQGQQPEMRDQAEDATRYDKDY